MKTKIDPQLKLQTPPAVQNKPSPAAAAEARQLLLAAGVADKIEVTPSFTGWSGMLCFHVERDGQAGHLKLSPASAPLDGAFVAREFASAGWAAQRGLGPAVLWMDQTKQALLTAFVADESKAAQAVRTWGPVTKANVRALAQLHRSEQGPVRAFDHRAELASLDQRLQQARESGGKGPLQIADVHSLGQQIIERLEKFPVREGLCHGDMNGCNSLYTRKQVYIIDWANLGFGDPIKELANFGLHIGLQMAQMPTLWRVYAGGRSLARPEFEQLKLQLCLHHCSNYLARFKGMPWHDPASRDEDLARIARQLHDDTAAFNLSAVG